MEINKNDIFKKSCLTINKLLKTENFYESLCAFSNNDIETVIENLAKIIDYYLATQDFKITYDLDTLFNLINNTTITSRNFVINPSNNHYYRTIKLYGLNSNISLTKLLSIDLEKLDSQLSFQPLLNRDFSTFILSDVKRAIKEAFVSPKILYKSILKQPIHKKKPLLVGESEQEYYMNILNTRMQNIMDESRKTSASIGKKAISDIIGQDILLTIIPKYMDKTKISEEDIENEETTVRISPNYLSFIKIPSYYKLLSICLKNQNTKEGSLINLDTGKQYPLEKSSPNLYSSLFYSTYELVSITDEFVYSNSEFTGDVRYDIDLIYGKLDGNKTKEKLSPSFELNLSMIKNRIDIIVRKINNRYEIRNGRHRILYLKLFYLENHRYYKEINAIDSLKAQLTIPMSVEKTIEDPNINNYLIRIERKYKQVKFLKVDITNDYPEIIIIINNSCYFIKSYDELKELYELLEEQPINKYYIGLNNVDIIYSYEKIMDYLILTLKEKLYQMSFYDIIIYIKNNNIIIDGLSINPDLLNYIILYLQYCSFKHNIQLFKLFPLVTNPIEEVKNKCKIEKISELITTILSENPNYLALDSVDLLNIIKQNSELSIYNDEFLLKCLNNTCYQTERLKQLYNDTNCPKKTKV